MSDDAHAAALAEAVAEERYLRERVDLYRAKAYSGRPTTAQRLRELERAHAGAQANLARLRAISTRS